MEESEQSPNATKENVRFTARLAAEYLKSNALSINQVPDLIKMIYKTLSEIKIDLKKELVNVPKARLILVNKSIDTEYLISMEDGIKYKTLRRHLGRLGLTPEQYRIKWNLPHDYPMVAQSYSEFRSRKAKETGLGRKRIDSLF